MKDPTKILIVDDRAENLLALEASLRREELVILKARSGAEALELLLTEDVGLAIVDVQMPAMDGFELAELMRGSERTSKVPIIFLTAGAADQERVFRGYESGAVDFLFKPFDSRVLASKVKVFVELDQQRRELGEAVRFRELFAGMLGHDLRNPLSAITNGTYLLESMATDEKAKSIAGRVSRSAHRMARMIEDILDFTRLRLGGGIPLTKTKHDLVPLIRTIVDEMQLGRGAPMIAVESAGDTRVSCDGQRVLQSLSNLIGNAVQHGAAGSPIVVRVDGTEADWVTIAVRNKGTIAADLLPYVFDPFQRANHSAIRARSGLGLGLYIVHQIADAHGGSVSVESNDDTTFVIKLPR